MGLTTTEITMIKYSALMVLFIQLAYVVLASFWTIDHLIKGSCLVQQIWILLCCQVIYFSSHRSYLQTHLLLFRT